MSWEVSQGDHFDYLLRADRADYACRWVELELELHLKLVEQVFKVGFDWFKGVMALFEQEVFY